MIMNFKNLEEAKDTIYEGHKKCHDAMEVGDVKTNNQIISKKVNPAFEYLKNNNGLRLLIEFLKHDDVGLRLATARSLLPYYEDISIDVLNDIIKKEIPKKSWKAEIILKEWKGESLKF